MSVQEALAENYKRAFGKRIGFGSKPALILIDFVQAYFDRSCSLFADVEGALASALRILAVAREVNIPIIYTCVTYAEGGTNGGRFYQKSLNLHNFVAGNPMGAWAAGIAPETTEVVISKQYPSAFFGTSLAPMLTALGVDTLIHTGLSTSGCVRATCVDCCSYGFIPIVVRDAVGDRHSQPHEANLFDMDAKYGDVVEEDQVIQYLRAL